MTKPSNTKKDAALVLGMHRSGTSCFTRCLNILGYSVPKTLIGIDESNKSGHWESRKIARLNDSILKKLDMTWSSWSIANLDLLKRDELKNFESDITSTLKSEFNKTGAIVIKEPRVCRFTSLYIEALQRLDYNSTIYTVMRNPLEVMESLNRRNNISRSDGALLWLRYNLDAEYASRNTDSLRFFVDYQQLIKSPIDTFASLETKLSIDYPQNLNDVSQRLLDFVSPSERNHLYSVEAVSHDELTRGWIEDVYSALLVLCNNPYSKGSFDILDRVRAEFDIATPNMLKIVKSKNQVHNKSLEDLNLNISKKEKKFNELSSAFEEKMLALKKLETDFNDTQKAISLSKANEIKSLSKLEEVEGLLNNKNQSLEALQKEVSAMQETLSISSSQNNNLIDGIQDMENSLNKEIQSREALEQELNMVQNALSISDSQNESLIDDIQKIEISLNKGIQSRETLEQELNVAQNALSISDSQNESLIDDIQKLKVSLNENTGLKSELDSQKHKHKDTEKRLKKAHLELKNTEQKLSDVDEKLSQALGESSQLEATLAARGKEYEKLKSEAKALEVNVSKSKQEYNALENNYNTQIELLNTAQGELFDLSVKGKELRKLNRRLQKDRWNLQDQVRFYKDQVEAYHSSTSWRITAPIRGVKNFLKLSKHRLLDLRKPQSLNKLSVNQNLVSQRVTLGKLTDNSSHMSDDEKLNLILTSNLFDSDYYSTQYPDFINDEIQPVEHYYSHGWKQGCNPNAAFNSLAYIAANPNIKGQNICPLVHFIENNNNLIQKYNAPNRDKSKNLGKIVVFTAIAGNYDELKPPLQVSENVDYVYFSEKEIFDLSVWQYRRFDYFDFETSRTARFVKTHPHIYFKDYDWAIWVDANIQLNCMPEDLIRGHENQHNFILFGHPYRDCLYQESQECIKRNKDTSNLLSKQVNRYKKIKFPTNAGLYETGVSISKPKDEAIVKLMNVWWREILMGSKRDQVSLPIALQESKVNVGQMSNPNICVRTDPRFIYFKHL